MKAYLYTNPDDDRYRFHVRETVNGYTIQVLVVERGENIPLTPSVASRAGVTLPDTYRLQTCSREAAELQLQQLAELNGWVEVTPG